MRIAHAVRVRSNCMKRSVGALIVKNKRILSTGYNGTATGQINCFDGGCPRCNSNTSQGIDLHKCYCIHAEESALLELGKKKSQGATCYSTLYPCTKCAQLLIGHVKKLYLGYQKACLR